MAAKLIGILVIALLLASGCSSSDPERREIIATLAMRTHALNSRNCTEYVSVVSKQYSDKNKNYAQLKDSLEKNFRDFEAISYEPEALTVTVSGNSAKSTGNYRMKIKLREKEMIVQGTEHIRLLKEAEGWKIIAGI